MDPRPRRAPLSGLAWLVGLVVGAAVLTVVSLLVLTAARDEAPARLFLDTYELTGSRLAGLVSLIGVLLLAAAAAISLFAAALLGRDLRMTGWRRFLAVGGGLTLLLALDDLLAVHELADDVVARTTGFDAHGPAKDLLELLVLGTYGILFGIWLWRSRSLVAHSDWVLLVIGGGLLLASLALDVAPHAWLAESGRVSISAQSIVEDTLKLAGIAVYAAYLVRTAASGLRAASPTSLAD